MFGNKYFLGMFFVWKAESTKSPLNWYGRWKFRHLVLAFVAQDCNFLRNIMGLWGSFFIFTVV